jgi:hypothetical protein
MVLSNTAMAGLERNAKTYNIIYFEKYKYLDKNKYTLYLHPKRWDVNQKL